MTSVRAVRVAAAAQLADLGIRVHDVWPSTINPPAAIVRPLSGTFDETFGGATTYQLELVLLLQMGHLETSQEQLDAYLAADGDLSIKAALEEDQTWGGVVQSVEVKGWREYGSMVVGAAPDGSGPEYLGCKFDIEVFA